MTAHIDVLEDALEDLLEHAETLRALAERLDPSDPDAARSARSVAHELLELRKELGDGRRGLRPHGAPRR